MLLRYKGQRYTPGWGAICLRRRLVGIARCREMPVHYYLLVNGESGGRRMYGILVKCGGDREVIPEITPSRRRVQSLLGLLIQGRVTPVTVRDVVEDWLLA